MLILGIYSLSYDKIARRMGTETKSRFSIIGKYPFGITEADIERVVKGLELKISQDTTETGIAIHENVEFKKESNLILEKQKEELVFLTRKSPAETLAILQSIYGKICELESESKSAFEIGDEIEKKFPEAYKGFRTFIKDSSVPWLVNFRGYWEASRSIAKSEAIKNDSGV